MPVPLIPLLAVAGLGGVAYFVHRRRVGDGAQYALPAEEIEFVDRGFVVRVRQSDEGWRWTATREGYTPRSGVAPSRDDAITASLQWVSSRALPPPKTVHQLPPAKKPPRTPTKTAPGPRPTSKVGKPAASTPTTSASSGAEPPKPAPKVATTSMERRVVRSGLRLEGSTITLTDLHDYVADAFGAFDPFVDAPAAVVAKLLQGVLPELGDVEVASASLTLVNDKGETRTLTEAAQTIERLQSQLLAPDLDPQLVPFAADILAEAIFGTEQRLRGERFSYRGRTIFARPSGSGFRWSIRDAVGMHGPSDAVFPTREAAHRDAIVAISSVDAEAAA